MPRERGFTLIELTLALTVLGVVALLVYGAVGVALDTQERLVARERMLRSEAAWHVVVEQALRNLRANGDDPRRTLVVSPNVDASGRPRDRLQFITAGGMPPLTGDADWAVTLEATDLGMSLTAAPIGVRAPARHFAGLPEITGLSVRVLEDGDDGAWLNEWTDARRLPRAIELTYWTESGPVSPSMLLVVPLQNVP